MGGEGETSACGGVVSSHSEQQNQVLTKRAARGDPVSTTQARQGSLPDEEGIGAARPAAGGGRRRRSSRPRRWNPRRSTHGNQPQQQRRGRRGEGEREKNWRRRAREGGRGPAASETDRGQADTGRTSISFSLRCSFIQVGNQGAIQSILLGWGNTHWLGLSLGLRMINMGGTR